MLTDASFVWVARDIHRNPLALRGIRCPSTDRWSSYRTYLGHRRVPPFLVTEPLVSMFAGDVRRLIEMTEDESVRYASDRALEADDVLQLVDCAIAADDLDGFGAPGQPRAVAHARTRDR